MMAAITSAALLMSQFFQLGLGYSPLATGLRFLPWTATPAVIAPAAGALADRIGTRPLLAAGLLLQAAGLGWVALAATTTVGYGHLVLPLIVAGVGISMALPAAPTAALGAVPPPDMGKASGVLNTLQRFGSVFGVAVITAVFAGSGHLGTMNQQHHTAPRHTVGTGQHRLPGPGCAALYAVNRETTTSRWARTSTVTGTRTGRGPGWPRCGSRPTDGSARSPAASGPRWAWAWPRGRMACSRPLWCRYAVSLQTHRPLWPDQGELERPQTGGGTGADR